MKLRFRIKAGGLLMLVRACSPDQALAKRSSPPRANGHPSLALVISASSFDFGPVAPARMPLPNPPSGTFTLENIGNSTLHVSFTIRRTGSAVDSGQISEPDDSALFSIRLINPDGRDSPITSAQIGAGQRQTFLIVFNPVLPSPAGRTSGLSAGQVLSDVINSVLTITPNAGVPITVPITGRVTTGARILNLLSPALAPRVQMTRSTDGLTVEFAAWDANNDVRFVTYQFVDGAGRIIKEVVRDPLDPAAMGLVRGQSFVVTRRFVDPTPRGDALGVVVTLY